MTVRPSTALAALFLASALAAAGLAAHAAWTRPALDAAAARNAALVARLGLTDLALFTEARHTRNPSMADRFAPFGEHPRALEHFPSGSLVPPP